MADAPRLDRSVGYEGCSIEADSAVTVEQERAAIAWAESLCPNLAEGD